MHTIDHSIDIIFRKSTHSYVWHWACL